MRIVPERLRSVQTGQKSERLEVIGIPFYVKQRGWPSSRAHVVCQCECGTVTVVRCDGLGRKGGARSCGCLKLETAHALNYRHGGTGTRLSSILISMRQRCDNSNNPCFQDYGGRGIYVCQEWSDFTAFRDWALANGYSDDLEIDRIDNNGPYSPENCRWVTRAVQCRNTRKTKPVVAFGETKTVAEWARDQRCVVSEHTLRHRLSRGHAPETAITTASFALVATGEVTE